MIKLSWHSDIVTLYTTWENTWTAEYRSSGWLQFSVKKQAPWGHRRTLCVRFEEISFIRRTTCLYWQFMLSIFTRKLLISCMWVYRQTGPLPPHRRVTTNIMSARVTSRWGFGGFKVLQDGNAKARKRYNAHLEEMGHFLLRSCTTDLQ